jgi:hypothetical protein
LVVSFVNPADPAIERLRALAEPEHFIENISKRRSMRKLQVALESQSTFSSGLAVTSRPSDPWNSKPMA